MTLEEAQHWIKRYEAFLEHNKDVLNNEGIKVSSLGPESEFGIPRI